MTVSNTDPPLFNMIQTDFRCSTSADPISNPPLTCSAVTPATTHQEKQTPGAAVADRTEDSPGPAPAPETELLPSDLSSDWPTGRDGKHENTGDGRKDGGGVGQTITTTRRVIVAHKS